MTKRQKFVISSVLLAFGFFLTQFVDLSFKYQALAGLSLVCVLLSVWSLWGGLGRNATLLVLVLPVFFTAGIGLFYFLLPATFITRVPILILYAIGIYALLLTANIYTVSTARTIALLRAAHAVGFLLTLVAGFLLFDTVFSLRLSFWSNAVFAFFISFPLLLQGFWSIELENLLSREVLYMGLVFSIIVSEIMAVLSFWPITVPVAALAITTVVYIGLGLGQAKLQQRLFAKTVREYLLVGAAVFITMFLTAKWGG
ncbi:MAG: hypothetical protein HYS83_01685 [Candidatus Blackburnbacteria bacterium]|nr:hypothetical protein [Candidatus Blackburnbacteria bacterium]